MRVLVTGGSGFIAGHCIIQLLNQGYDVRATLRATTLRSREAAVRGQLSAAGLVNGDALGFVAADLADDAGWAAAVRDCDYVLHVASPVHTGNPRNEDEVIAPARNGTLRVLRAARDAGVKRVVLTSAFHAVGFGHPHSGHTFTEDDWSVLDGPGMDAYGRSKTLAERAAWDFVAAEGGRTELATILPVGVLGPVLGREVSGTNHLVQRLLKGEMPGVPHMYVPIVDVRDVAAAHILAMTVPEAAGRRFLVSSGAAMSMKQIGAVLRDHLGAAASRVPTRTIPDAVVRLAALFNREFRPIVSDLGYAKKVSSDRARSMLGWTARAPEEAILAAASSMLDASLAG